MRRLALRYLIPTPRSVALSSLRALGSLGLLVAVTLSGCGHDDAENGGSDCYFGEERQCTSDDGCVGISACQSGRWGECGCPEEVPVPSPGVATRRLGNACSGDAECVDGALCLLPSSTAWFGGGPPKGLCVADCSNDKAVCDAFETSLCVSPVASNAKEAKSAFCMPTCELNRRASDTVNCSLVPASACDRLEGNAGGFCRPFCRFDSDCPSGNCDGRYGSCVSAPAESSPIGFGQSCGAGTPSCDGVCLSLSAGRELCSRRCTAGDTSECADNTQTRRASVCAYQGSASFEPGNLGYCAPLCDCNADCVAAGFVCKAFSASTSAALGRVGVCYPSIDSNGALEPGVACATQ